jgi:anti-sigma-K factor RskA
MLSHEDRRRLAAIERQLLIDDPAFTELFTRSRADARRVRVRVARRVAAAVVAILCALAAVVGLMAGSVPLVVSGVSMAMVAGWVVRRARRPAR